MDEKVANQMACDSASSEGRISSENFTKDILEEAQTQNVNPSASCIVVQESQLSEDVDRWINGNTSMENTGVQNSRSRLVQRSTLAMVPSLRTSGMWCILSLVLPLLNISPNYSHWRCSPSTVLTTAEMLLAHISAICERIRNQISRLARDQVLRDIFATAMDVVLVAYAVGFLILSMYQSSIIR